MTVIASYNYFGCGMVIGDILINGPVSDKNVPSTTLPTLGNVEDFFGGGWGIHQSTQKVCIISDVCAIAWAGTQVYAKQFIRRIKRLSQRITITSEIIRRLYEKHYEKHIEVAGALYENGQIKTFGLGCNITKCPNLGTVYSGGSGASIIQDYIDMLKELKLDVPRRDEIACTGVSLAITQVAHLLNAEFRKGFAADSIMELFGGGYEIAAFYDGKFHKIRSNFIFLDVSLVDDYLDLGCPRLIISQSYSGDTLQFRAISTQGDDDNNVVRNDFIDVYPLLNSPKPECIDKNDLEINWACFVFVDNFKFFGKVLNSLISKSQTPPFSFDVIDGKLEFFYSDKAREEITTHLMNSYRNM